MADVNNIIDLDCEESAVYTGIGDCPFELGIPQGMIAIPRGTTFSAVQWADIQTELAEMATEEPFTTRAVPIGIFSNMTAGSGESVVETTDFGFITKVKDAPYDWTFRVGNDLGYHLQLKQIDGKQQVYDFILWFKNGVVGTLRRNATSGDLEHGGFRFSMIDVLNPTFATGSAPAQYSIRVQMFDTDQFNRRLTFQKVDNFDFTDIVGVQQVIMTGAVNASPAGSIDLTLKVKYGGKNLIDIFGSALASTTLFDAFNVLTGNAITLTGVTIVGDEVRVQADTTDTDYPASAAQWKVVMSDIADWVTAGIVGYETTNVVTVTRP